MLRHIKPGMLVFSVLYILLGLLLLLAPQAVADVFCIALSSRLTAARMLPLSFLK